MPSVEIYANGADIENFVICISFSGQPEKRTGGFNPRFSYANNKFIMSCTFLWIVAPYFAINAFFRSGSVP